MQDQSRIQQQKRARQRQRIASQQPTAANTPLVQDAGLNDIDVGSRLRELRTARGLSIRALAELSGLNVNTLSLIENDKSSPSVGTLQQLARALDKPVTVFFETGAPKAQVVFQKASVRPAITFAHGVLLDLGAGMTSLGAEPFIVILEAHADSGPAPIVHTGREFVYCLEGKVSYQIEEQEYQLEPGDSLFFEAHLPHRWANAGLQPSRSLLVLCPADENDRPTERHFSPKQENPREMSKKEGGV